MPTHIIDKNILLKYTSIRIFFYKKKKCARVKKNFS